MMSVELVTLGFFKIKVTWNNSYDVIVCPWLNQQNFIMLLKLYCRRGHMTKL